MSPNRSQLEAFERAPEDGAVTAEFRDAGSSGVTLVRESRQPAGLYRRPVAQDVILYCILSGSGPISIDHGVRFRQERLAAGDLCLPPSRMTISYEPSQTFNGLAAVIPAAVVSSALTSDDRVKWNGDFGRLHTSLFRDDAITGLLLRLWHESGDDAPRSAMLFDAAWHTIAHLLFAASGGASEYAGGKAQRGDWRVRRAVEYLEARLGDDVGLAEVAAVVDLSSSHFAALFRTETGESPYRWLTRRRLERARELLVDARRSVTDVALTCGFASSQHFATAFRKQLGVTPTQYRHDRLS